MMGSMVADDQALVESIFPQSVKRKFEIFSYRNAAAILAMNFQNEFEQIVDVLRVFEITKDMIRLPGGGKGPIATYVKGLFPSRDW